MNVQNIHKRQINQPKSKIIELLFTLASQDDKIWPYEKWPPLKLKKGLNIGSEGGHGPIRYKLVKYNPTGIIEFEFQKPKGYIGTHRFEVTEKDENKTELKHSIEMNTKGTGTISWVLAVRSLHDALLEDTLDKVENQFTNEEKRTRWSIWVKILRKILK